MTGKWRLLCALAVGLALATGVCCSRVDSSVPVGTEETIEASPSSLAGALDPGTQDGEGLGAFPAFMPPVATGTDAQECHLGTDPYSTCI